MVKWLILAMSMSIAPMVLKTSHAQTGGAAPPALQEAQTILRNMSSRGGDLEYTPPAASCGFSVLSNIQTAQGLGGLIQWREGYAFIRTNPELYCPLTVVPNRSPLVLGSIDTQLVPARPLLSANRSKRRLSAATIRSQCFTRLASLRSIQINRAETNTIELETTTRTAGSSTVTCREIMSVRPDTTPASRPHLAAPVGVRQPVIPRVQIQTPGQGYELKGSEAE